MTLWQSFQTNTQRPIHKWKHYFPAYERHFGQLANRTMTFVEIGCGRGGSLQMWKRFFGPFATIVGLDINPQCAKFEEDQIQVRIGDQSDSGFLQSIIDEFGVPDGVLDDGSHKMKDVSASFEFLYPLLGPNSVYMVEDLHTAYMPRAGGGLRAPASFIERCKTLIDELNGDHAADGGMKTKFTETTLSMHFYDSAVVFEKGRHGRKIAPMIPRPAESDLQRDPIARRRARAAAAKASAAGG